MTPGNHLGRSYFSIQQSVNIQGKMQKQSKGFGSVETESISIVCRIGARARRGPPVVPAGHPALAADTHPPVVRAPRRTNLTIAAEILSLNTGTTPIPDLATLLRCHAFHAHTVRRLFRKNGDTTANPGKEN